MQSPWGKVDQIDTLADGIVSVSTPSHGGIMVRQDVALARLSTAAQARGEWCGNFMSFEEDCLWAIVAFEVPDLWPKRFHQIGAPSPDAHRAELLATLSAWNADYLLERGITPDTEHYKFWLANRRSDEMRSAKHPDLIVAAFGEWDTKRPGVVRVITADQREHFVTTESYHAKGVNLLSQCEIVGGSPDDRHAS